MPRRLVPALAALALVAAARNAAAYCRSSTCPDRGGGSSQGQICYPAGDGDCGVELQWRQPCVGFNVYTGASNQVDYDTAELTLRKAFDAWTTVQCATGGSPSIQVFDLGSVSCPDVEYNQHAGNTNVLVFRDDGWPHAADSSGGSADTIALTTVTYDVDLGDIYDADIEVNSANYHFTTNDTPGAEDVDLLSVLTHETGHFLGLAHTPVTPATMYPDYSGGIDMRILSPDDEDAICEAYPADRTPTGDCTAIPRHGFAPECAADQTYVRCAAGRAPGDAGGSAIALSLAIAAAAITARRGSRRS